MKRQWQEKIDGKGLQLIEAHARQQKLDPPRSLNRREFSRWMREQNDILSSYPDLAPKKQIRLKPEFVRSWIEANPELIGDLNRQELQNLFEDCEWPSFIADSLELAQKLWLTYESHPQKRAEAYVSVAGWIVLLRSLSAPITDFQFGKKIDGKNLGVPIAQFLNWIARMLREGRIAKPPIRANLELVRLVNAILEHQKERLTQLELYHALKAAGAEVPEDPEAFRVWLYRAKKRGLIKNSRPKPNDFCSGH
jgi:hypothetical protein